MAIAILICNRVEREDGNGSAAIWSFDTGIVDLADLGVNGGSERHIDRLAGVCRLGIEDVTAAGRGADLQMVAGDSAFRVAGGGPLECHCVSDHRSEQSEIWQWNGGSGWGSPAPMVALLARREVGEPELDPAKKEFTL